MRRILYILAMVLLGSNVAADDELAADKIYFFTHKGCPFCEMAEEYIAKNMTDVAIEHVDIDKPGGMFLFRKCVQKFKLGREIGTPLFCMGDDYLMGWSEDNLRRFVELVERFKK